MATTDIDPGAPTEVMGVEPNGSAPRLAEGIELIGEYRDSGFRTAPFLARRSDGQTLQLPEILYRVAEAVDGRRDYPEIAAVATEACRRQLGAEDVQALIEGNLREIGVVAAADGSSPKLAKADPLLGLKFKTKVVPSAAVRAVTTIFRPLFLPPVVLAVVAGLIALDGWLFFSHGIAPSVRAALYQPAVLLALFGGVVLATAFHEIGHATALRYGGGRPGVMGVGIYVVWPAFYTDVTDAYRLSKAGRLRTDLGGVYFNAIFALLTAGLYALTSFEPLLLLVMAQNFAILQQLMPLLRLDGYYILTDMTGVPDLLGRMKPILRSVLPGREPDAKVSELKPWVRWVVTAYVGLLVPFLLFVTVMMIIAAPRVIATAWDSFGVRLDKAQGAFGKGDTLAGIADVLQLTMLCLPALGMAYSGTRVARMASSGAWSWSEDSQARRGGLIALTTAAAALAAFTWWPNGEYRPLQPDERGRFQDVATAVAAIPSGRPGLTAERERELGGAPGERDRLDGAPTETKTTRSSEAERRAAARKRAAEKKAAADATPTAEPTAEATPESTPATAPTAEATPTAEPTPAATAEATPTAEPTP
jgi:putative peptide zinc metalloprotease protein